MVWGFLVGCGFSGGDGVKVVVGLGYGGDEDRGKGIMGCWCSELVLFEIDELEVAIQEIKRKVVARSGEIISNGEDQD
ncbi:Hypothetical predicted protein [Olea europaea subsp. europaea]|uniref:Uncharacterized protein n=1 Tax=Olea europaea subsp. europaea TaxID=158383 RepID=A0A8S0TAT4_OLEEU|nr:Hypothetical predicted protein [Olea europaea subsp. europaea]